MRHDTQAKVLKVRGAALQGRSEQKNWIGLSQSLLLVALFFFSPCLVAAQPARIYIDSALAALGGRETLLKLKSQRIVSHGENFEPEQAVRPGGEPRKASTFTCTLTRDLSNGNVRYEWQRETFPPFTVTWRYSEILSGDQGAILGADGARSPAKHAASAARIAARRKELGRSPVSVLLNALARSSSLLRLADQMIYGHQQYVVSFDDGGQFVIIALDAQSRLLTKVEFLEDDPLDGDTNNELFLTDWRQVGALKLPFELTYRVNGQIVMTEHIDSIENDLDISAVNFTIPEDLAQTDTADGRRGEQSSQWILRRIALASPLDDEQTRVELTEVAKGVFHVTGGTHHSLAIEMSDHLIVVDAPLYEERSQAVLAALGKKFPGKPVRFVVSTHFHNDHSGGLRAYVAAGATVVTGKVNEQFYSQVFTAKHTRVPDSLQQNPKPAVIETIDSEKKVLTDGTRIVEIYPVVNSHAEGMLVVYLPREKLLFVADLFSPGAPRQVSAWCGELLAALERYDLKVDRIAGGHGNKISTLAELRQAATSPAS
ncbi:MAG: MBL fold metallo-hydrolase [Deltaproteobacteria bacterium]|nr:MBL fold metallo-hydrolase [Deltaproteobacteria bacterium]